MEYRIPEGIEVIDQEWVKEHVPVNATKVVCPTTLKEIGRNAFFESKIKYIKLFNNLQYIGGGAFANSSLIEIKIPGKMKKIDNSAFRWCYDLKEIILCDGIEEIADFAFSTERTKIDKVVIPNSVKNISSKAFLNDTACLDKYVYLISDTHCINGEVIIGSKSPIAKLSDEELKEIFGPNANIIIKDLEDDINYAIFNNIKKVSDEERYKLGLELFDEINKDEIDLTKIQELLINGADTEIRDSNGNTGLMLMIKKGNNEVSMMYLLSGCDVNARNKLKETPLILASRSNNNDIAFQLIDRNCIVNAMNVFDESALSIAYDNGNIELVNRLESIFNISSKEKELEEVYNVRKRILGGK